MVAHRHIRAGGVVTRLLLVLVLALGVFVMHTVGHPDEASSPGMSAAAHASSADHMSGDHGAARDMGVVPSTEKIAEKAGHGPELTGPGASPYKPGHGMDMTSFCVAVLCVWALTALLRAVLARRRTWSAAPLSAVLAALHPNPPPRAPNLARLSVLRI